MRMSNYFWYKFEVAVDYKILSLSTIMDVYFYRLGIFFQSIFDVNSQVTWNTKLVTYMLFIVPRARILRQILNIQLLIARAIVDLKSRNSLLSR